MDTLHPSSSRSLLSPGLRRSRRRIDLRGIALVLACSSPVAAQVSSDAIPGLAAWWRAENTALDEFGLSDGTLVGGSSFAGGSFGNAFEFNGSTAYVDVVPGSNLDFGTGDFSMSVWINLDTLSVGSTDGSREIFHKVIGTPLVNSQGYFLEYMASTAQLRFAIGQGGFLQNDLRVAASLVVGQWHHVAAVRSGETNSIYLDGLLLGFQTSGTSVDTGTGGVARIGNIAPHGIVTPRFFDGRIDELAVYDRALTPTDVAKLAGVASVPALSWFAAALSAVLMIGVGTTVLRRRQLGLR